jgi:hypothetical protein
MHWQTLKKILAHSEPPGYRQQQPRPRKKLGAYWERIRQILQEDQAMPRKQRHTAKRIWERLREAGFTGGYTVVKDAVRELTATGQGDCFAGGIIGRGRAWRLNVTCTNAITLDGIRLTRARTGVRQRHLIPGQPCRPGDRLDHALNDYFKPAPEPGDLVELVQHELVLFTVVVPQPPPSAEAADDFSGMYFRDAPVPARRVGRNVPVPARQTLYFDRANLTVRLELDLFDDTLDGNQLVRTFHGEMAGEKVFVGKPEAGRPDSTAMVTWNDPPRAIKLQFHGDTAEVTFEKRTNSVTATFTRKVR